MKMKPMTTWLTVLTAVTVGTAGARPPKEQPAPLNAAGQKLEVQYTSTLKGLKEEVAKALPTVAEQKKAALEKTGEDTKKAEAEAAAAQAALGKVNGGKALIEHAKGKWIGGAEKGIAAAQAALKKATTAAEREAAEKDLAKWQANKEQGVRALKERTEAYEKAKAEEPRLSKANQAAQAALAQARTNERNAANAILADLAPVMASDKLDAKLDYQNIIMNGGICGRRAFFGRFILQSFGIPTWGVTQHAHAALSHWTPKGWVVNLGAGFQASWWEKDEVPLSGTQFLLETQARAHAQDYLKVLRAQWASRILGEPAYNERKKIAGGLWSTMGHLYSVMLSEQAVALGPLGQELGEANEKGQKIESAAVSAADQKVEVKPDGTIVIPAVAYGKATGKGSAMKSFAGGMQLHSLGGFAAPYEFQVSQAGTYVLSARVATVQTGQIFQISTNDSKQPVETPVPYTNGMWQQTEPIKVTLDPGKNILHFELKPDSRGVTIKEFTLTPVK